VYQPILANQKLVSSYDDQPTILFCKFSVQISQWFLSKSETILSHLSSSIGCGIGDKAPVQSICTWLQCHGRGIVVDQNIYAHPYDIYVIGTQESAMTEKDWVNFIKKQIAQCGFGNKSLA
jgi:hypothetical protein